MELLPPTRFLNIFWLTCVTRFSFLRFCFSELWVQQEFSCARLCFFAARTSLGCSWASCIQIHYCFVNEFVSLPGCCDASTAADGRSLPAAAPPSATLQFPSARVPACSASASRRKVEGLRPAAVAGRSGLHRGRPVFLHACGVHAEEASQRPPAPDQPSLARGLGRGRLSCHIALALALSLLRPSACRRGHAYTHAHVQCSAPLHITARCKEGQW